MVEDVLRGYSKASADLIRHYEWVSPSQLYAPVADLLLTSSLKIADIGAGTGRDAAWLADQGHDVVAVEPVKEFRQAGKALHKSQKIEWLDDRLPHLHNLIVRSLRFDRVLLTAVWQHLDKVQRWVAMRSLADLTAPGGMLIMSLRHGPGVASRLVHEAHPEETIRAALHLGFQLIRERHTQSVQAANRAAGVQWTWLVFGQLLSPISGSICRRG